MFVSWYFPSDYQSEISNTLSSTEKQSLSHNPNALPRQSKSKLSVLNIIRTTISSINYPPCSVTQDEKVTININPQQNPSFTHKNNLNTVLERIHLQFHMPGLTLKNGEIIVGCLLDRDLISWSTPVHALCSNCTTFTYAFRVPAAMMESLLKEHGFDPFQMVNNSVGQIYDDTIPSNAPVSHNLRINQTVSIPRPSNIASFFYRNRQKQNTKLRSSACSLYLIFASIGYGLYLNTVSLLRLLQIGFNFDPSAQWSWFCKLRFFAVGFLLMLPRSYMVLATIDRYLMSKTNQHWFLRRPVTWKMIFINCVFWMIICIHNIIFYDIQVSSNSTERICSNQPGSYSTFLSFYSIFINGLSIPFFMILFGFLTLRNIKSVRNRIHVNIIHSFQRRKREEWILFRMLLIQLFVTIILTLPITIYLCYNGLTQYERKSSFRIFIENYIYQMCTLLQYINAAISFIVYSLTSRMFRRELFLLIERCTIEVRERSAALIIRFNQSFIT
ncbi:hypothetical protein I4U23_015409 [Adineta vaga]|nr:hypothetical protein I4U23_015409 [Adineta vaga]